MSQKDPVETGAAASAEKSPDRRPAQAKTPRWYWTIGFALFAIALGVNAASQRGDPRAAWIIVFPVLSLALVLWARRRALTEEAAEKFDSLAQVGAFAGFGLAAWSTSTTSGWSTYFGLVLIGIAGVGLWYIFGLLRLPTITRKRDVPDRGTYRPR